MSIDPYPAASHSPEPESLEWLEQRLHESVQGYQSHPTPTSALSIVWYLEILVAHPDCCGASLPVCAYRRLAGQWRYIAYAPRPSVIHA